MGQVLLNGQTKLSVAVNLITENKCEKKSELHYELYGSSGGAEKKGLWRWSIYAGREKKPVLVGSFYGALPDAKKHAEAAITRLKERIRKHLATTKKCP